MAKAQEKLSLLIRNYRLRGHNIAKVNPVYQNEKKLEVLDYKYYSFREEDLDQNYSTLDLPGPDSRPLREIIEMLQRTYCDSIGVQFMHIDDIEVRHWLQHRFEATENHTHLTHDDQLEIFKRLTDAVEFEQVFDPNSSLKVSMGLPPVETAHGRIDLIMDVLGEKVAAKTEPAEEFFYKAYTISYWDMEKQDAKAWLDAQFGS